MSRGVVVHLTVQAVEADFESGRVETVIQEAILKADLPGIKIETADAVIDWES